LLRNTNVQEQEYIDGIGVGVECLYDHGRCVWSFVHERIHELPLTGGGSSYRRSLAAAEKYTRPAHLPLDSLRWHGVAMVEFKLTKEGLLVLMEVNPRLWGSLALPVDCGVDFPLGLLKLAQGKQVPPQAPYKVGYFSRNVESDVMWMKENLRA